MAMIKKINNSKTVPAILEFAGKLKTNEEKVEYLRKYRNKTLDWVIDAIYNKEWHKIEVPVCKPSSSPEGASVSNLSKFIRRLDVAYACRETNPKLTAKNLAVAIESVSLEESDILLNLLHNKRKIPGISVWVLRKAFPDILKNDVKEMEDK